VGEGIPEMWAPTFHLIKAIISGMPSPQHIFTSNFLPNSPDFKENKFHIAIFL
jgi:hypothetical protein